MCIYCLITCKCIVQIYYTRGNHFCSIRTFSCLSMQVLGVWWQIWWIMYGMYVHIKAVTYVPIPNKHDFLQKFIRQK